MTYQHITNLVNAAVVAERAAIARFVRDFGMAMDEDQVRPFEACASRIEERAGLGEFIVTAYRMISPDPATLHHNLWTARRGDTEVAAVEEWPAIERIEK
jgi:hypothetical protein